MFAKTDYEALGKSLRALIRDIPYETANLANASALLWEAGVSAVGQPPLLPVFTGGSAGAGTLRGSAE